MQLFALLMAVVPLAGGGAPVEGGAAGAAPAPVAAAAASPTFSNAEALLDALEKADAGLVSFEADIEYDRRFELQGDQHIRRGRLFFKSEPPEAPADGADGKRAVFAVQFHELQIDNSIRTEEQTFVFDGEWFIERNAAAKRFIKRQVAMPGERINPLRLGEGPFPVPIGQKKADILARYEARLAPREESLENEDHLKGAFLEGTTQLVLTPRAEFDRDELREIRLWYRSEDGGRLLPRLTRTLDRKGDVSLVRLVGMKVNSADFPADIVSIAAPPRGDGWDVQEHLKRAGDE
ncbi:MAG: hypothetical protein ACKVZJ_05520 [Phycisphaerales bacterium]